MDDILDITVQFSGGLQTLFGNKNTHHIQILLSDPALKGNPPNIAYLIQFLSENLMNDARKNFFIKDDTVRPGILVLINNEDWELNDEKYYILQPKDEITFISTLHGG
ncbi:hypothetical protein T552_01802 [Pneumocystis carinii B80]|uniref:Ubiquitin-related modifier 1 n=1 Tax=Pneumocystis carinii (strain B80) TaxID=1408658 RepID=A0A0W4ZJJ5_PNEC8|nr:hypothetical protein T552_01802 [Pneumocystis carinii B80]KTW28542.1 hypothetical protein T552_01802 [Pneumocystis carinii B80]